MVAVWLVLMPACAMCTGDALRPANVSVSIDLGFLGSPLLTELVVVEGGIADADVLAAAQTLPIPGSITDAKLSWQTTSPGDRVQFNITTTSSNPSALTLAIDTGVNGTLNATRVPLLVRHVCKANGVFSVDLSVSLADSHTGEVLKPLAVSYRKECDLNAQTLSQLPSFCTPNSGATPSRVRYGPIRVATYNVYGFIGGGTNVQDKANEIVDAVIADNVDVVLLQQVFGSDAQGYLVNGLKDRYSYIVPRVKGTNTGESGLFMASKLRPRRCGFEQFSSSSGVDSLQSKGVFSALLDAGAGYSLYVFAGHLQHGSAAADVSTREAQATQAAVYMAAQVAAVATGTGSDALHFGGSRTIRMGVLAAGALNIQGITYTSNDEFLSLGSPQLNTFTDTLADYGLPMRDLYRELEPTLPGYTTVALNFTCTSAASTREFSCSAGESLAFPGSRVDYLLSFDRAPMAVNTLVASHATIDELYNANYNYVTVGGASFNTLSYHKKVAVTVTHSDAAGNAASLPAPLHGVVIGVVVTLVAAYRAWRWV